MKTLTNKLKIAIVDDHQIFGDGIRLLLENEEHIDISENTFQNGLQFQKALEEMDEHPQVVLMDIDMPVKDGIQTTKELLKKYPEINVLGLSMHNEKEYISRILKAGALGYVMKNTTKEELLHAIETVASGESYITGAASQVLLGSFVKKKQTLSEKLSKRELEVLYKIAKGLTTHEISDVLSISKNTVETHRKNLLYKLNAKNTAELVNLAYQKQVLILD